MKRFLSLFLALLFTIPLYLGTTPQAEPKIQVALLLDTSNSMDGLIDQAKSQLWKVVNEFATAKQNGESPLLEIALYEYGNDGLAKQEGFVRMIAPLTQDLDQISEKLFELTTNGGSEYCGWTIRDAVNNLKWDTDPNVLKVVFIAGNEAFSQGRVDYVTACKNAISKSIIVNTIFCGGIEEGVRLQWKEGADLADGKYINIDQNKVAVHIDTPQDSLINRLNEQLNSTYIAYGSQGAAFHKRQVEQDKNASAFGASILAERAASKSSRQYKNTKWDLVDAAEEDEAVLEEIETEALPAEMKSMNKQERADYVKKQSGKRKSIQKQIQQLSEERRKYLASKRQEQSENNTLDGAMIRLVREQAATKNFTFE